MPYGIKPRVNEAREFLEIAKDFKDPKEIIREALSNSWDASATKVSLKFDLVSMSGNPRRKTIRVEIIDDGSGMSSERPHGRETSEIEDFFNLGDSHKPDGAIGTKGHGAKIYYKSDEIIVDTWKNGCHIRAHTEVSPWESLRKGIVPTYGFVEDDGPGQGTRIIVQGFQAKQSDFESLERLLEYISWYTVAGSFGHYFGTDRTMEIAVKATAGALVKMNFGFNFPTENVDLSSGSDHYCRLFGPESIECGTTEDGVSVTVNIIGAILGESNRGSVPSTYDMMGLWLGKDYLRIERNNQIIEQVTKGQYWYRSMLIFANCQQFDLTANRNNIRNDQDEYDLAISGIRSFVHGLWNDLATVSYFEAKREEDDRKAKDKQEQQDKQKKGNLQNKQQQRLNEYQGRPNLNASGVKEAPLKEPRTEAETALLLQAMISSGHPGIDFRVGEYSTYQGTDLLVEYTSKGIRTLAWTEIVVTMENLFNWSHPLEGIHKVICWELGKVSGEITIAGGKTGKLASLGKGRYHLNVGEDSIEVYVLREILSSY